MIVILLVLILLTLLFGANAVKGGVASGALVICGGFLLIFVAVWIGSLFGENGATIGFWFGIGGLFLLIASKAPRVR